MEQEMGTEKAFEIKDLERRLPAFKIEEVNAMAGDQIQALWNNTESFLAEVNWARRQQIAVAERARSELRQLDNMADHCRSVIRWTKTALKNY